MIKRSIITSFISGVEEDEQFIHIYYSRSPNSKAVYCYNNEYSCAVRIEEFVSILINENRQKVLNKLFDRLMVPEGTTKERIALYQLGV